MIAPLRGRHRRLVIWVGAIAAVGFVAALLVRPSRPIEPRLRAVDTTAWTTFGPDGRLRAAIEGEPGNEFVSVARAPRLVAPDLLVYWAPGDGGAGDGGAGNAVLLGALGDPGVHRYRLPAGREGGNLSIQSRGHEAPFASYAIDDLIRLE